MRLGVYAALVDGRVIEGDVEVVNGHVAAVGLPVDEQAEGLAVPGFIDAHINGFAGIDFLGDERPDYGRAGAAMAAAGVTSYVPTFVTADPGETARALSALPSDRDAAGVRVLGAHLEGPFLSPLWAGAHDPSHLRAPDLGLLRELLGAGRVRLMTLAPELPGAMRLIQHLVEEGIVVSCGHSDASADQAHHAFDSGARAITHVHNAHRRWQPRDPGIAGAALVREDVSVQLIADHVHLAVESTRMTRLVARDTLCLVTDAVAAAGADGAARATSTLGNRQVRIEGQAVRLPDGTLAGSILTMDRAVRNLVAGGAELHEAIFAASAAPAALLGHPDLGRLAVGTIADITVLDADLQVLRTYVGGAVVHDARHETPTAGSSA